MKEPFWEAAYQDEDADAFGGEPSPELLDVLHRVPVGAQVLDAGCGEGRNALFLAKRGYPVLAFDVSKAAIRKLKKRGEGNIEARVESVEAFELTDSYGLVIADGLLQFLDRKVGDRFLADARAHTAVGGIHLISVFTDREEPPSDLAPFIRRVYGAEELREQYTGWEILLYRSYIKEDEHEGGLRHRHAIADLVARKS